MKYGNELIDSKVEELFNHLLYGENNYYVGRYPSGGVLFNIERDLVILTWFRRNKNDPKTNNPISIEYFNKTIDWNWEICPSDGSGFTFYLTIESAGGRQLVVPELGRIEEAKVLSRIEYLANNKELKFLDYLNNFLSNDDSN